MTPMVKRELHDLGDGLFAWVQGDGSWGWSNSGLITDGDQSLLVDTLFTGALTQDMLDAYRRATPAAQRIGTLVNTHANGDHTFGNHLVGDTRIIASQACADEMEERPAPVFQAMMAGWRDMGETGRFLQETMGSIFDFSDIGHRPPTETFSGRRTLQVGDRRIELTEFGPAHTRGDIVVHVPDARVVFTGDLLFSGSHPLMWSGPIGNWIAACEAIESWDVDVVVPGHGPVSTKREVAEMREYLVAVRDGATARHAAGLPWDEAAFDLGRSMSDDWLDRDRIIANVATVYRELTNGVVDPSREDIFRHMLRYREGAVCPHEPDAACACAQRA
ncbi:MBL fold metallo-hydrolase [Rhodobacterales bacterium HKCCE3408]|nr:MBL fold metallo-hydrolase [Rhodobacterales bacterium HKCCE3408]